MSAWDVAAIGIKVVLYAATFCAAGGIFFLLYGRSLISFEDERRVRRWVGLCATVAMAAGAVRLSILAGSMGEGFGGTLDGSMVRLLLEAGEARATGMRTTGLLMTGALLLDTPFGLLAAALGALLAATSFAWIGHAWAAGRWSVALLSLHLLAVAFWLGALVPLLLVGQSSTVTTLARIVRRFGDIAVVGVGVLLAAGSLLLATLLRHVSDVWYTEYGRFIGAKSVIVAMLLGAAAVNKFRFTPRLEAQDNGAAVGLLRSIRAELLFGGLILIITAALTSLVGPPGLE